MVFFVNASAKVFLGYRKFLRYAFLSLTYRLFYCNNNVACTPTLCYPFLVQVDVVLVWGALDDIHISNKTQMRLYNWNL